jgi:hypothetical protein
MAYATGESKKKTPTTISPIGTEVILLLVEDSGFEPLASGLQSRRSPN